MDRRESLKALALTALASGVIVGGCKSNNSKDNIEESLTKSTIDRTPEEEKADALLQSVKFFTVEEMATIGVLCDIIIPRDEISGSASDAKVPDFIEFIVKDMPAHQTPVRGGLRWLDLECIKRYQKSFTLCESKQRLALIDEIAYPNKAKPQMLRGVSFFNLMRNLTASGFYTSQIGIKDLNYMGNVPNQWNGVPDEVLKQYGYAYSEKELKECISFIANT